MTIDWKTVWTDALRAAGDAVPEASAAEKRHITRVAAARERRLRLLMLVVADRALEEETIKAELEDERLHLEMEFLDIRGMSKERAEDAAQAILGTIESALLQGIALSF